jgi:oligopeptide/dipeptide ABC transporter ATP-binding protein
LYEREQGPFALRARYFKAVDGVSLAIEQGKTLGLVGESGCGKSTLAKIILKLIRPSEGELFFQEQAITALPEKEFHQMRRDIQIVFQDPASSLSPRLRVYDCVAEPLSAFRFSKAEVKTRVREVIAQVGLPQSYQERLPAHLSGGERQRVGIARALATFPKLLVLDEAVSSLDLSTQAQILNLLVTLQRRYSLTYLFIAHNLHVVRHVSDDVAVMFRGMIIEKGPAEAVFENPAHPYTQMLVESMPSFSRRRAGENKKRIPREKARQSDQLFSGCCFFDYCPKADERCKERSGTMREAGKGHWTFCVHGECRGSG